MKKTNAEYCRKYQKGLSAKKKRKQRMKQTLRWLFVPPERLSALKAQERITAKKYVKSDKAKAVVKRKDALYYF